MTNAPLDKDVDANSLAAALLAKTEQGKLKWEATPAESTFVTSFGGDTTLRLNLTQEWDIDQYGEEREITVPQLILLGEKGVTVWIIHSSDVKGGLWRLFKLIRRVVYKVDDRVANMVDALNRM